MGAYSPLFYGEQGAAAWMDRGRKRKGLRYGKGREARLERKRRIIIGENRKNGQNIGEASQTEEQEDVKGRTFSNWHRTKGKDKNAKTREI